MNIISLKGDRLRWIDFVSEVKRNKERVWDVIERFIDEYTKKGGGR